MYPTEGGHPPRPSREARLLCQPSGLRAPEARPGGSVSVIAATSFVGDTTEYARAGLSARAPPRERHRAACTRTRSRTARASRTTRAGRPAVSSPIWPSRCLHGERGERDDRAAGGAARPNALTNSSFDRPCPPRRSRCRVQARDSSACRYAVAASRSSARRSSTTGDRFPPSPRSELEGSSISGRRPPSRREDWRLAEGDPAKPAPPVTSSAACSHAATTSAASPTPFRARSYGRVVEAVVSDRRGLHECPTRLERLLRRATRRSRALDHDPRRACVAPTSAGRFAARCDDGLDPFEPGRSIVPASGSQAT